MLQFSSGVLWFPFLQLFGLSALCHGQGVQNLVTEVNPAAGSTAHLLFGKPPGQPGSAAGVDVNLGTPNDTSCLAGNLGGTRWCLCP